MSKAVTRKDLLAKVFNETGIDQRVIDDVLNGFIRVVDHEVRECGQRISLPGLGYFHRVPFKGGQVGGVSFGEGYRLGFKNRRRR